MHNAKWLTGATCLNDIANENNIYRELAMLMYAPIKQIEETFEKSSEKLFINKTLFLKNLK